MELLSKIYSLVLKGILNKVMVDNKIEALRVTAMFGDLDESALKALAERTIERKLVQEEVLFMAGEPAHGLYVIVSGAIRAFRESVEGREQVIHVERAGATIGEVPVFDNGLYPSTASAESDTTILFIDKQDVRQLCLDYPQIALNALKVLASRLRKTAALVETLSLHEVDQRLAGLLLSEIYTRGIKTDSGTIIELVLTHQQIASRIGTVREVVSRALNRLQNNGLIHIDGRRILIPNEKALATYQEM